MNITITDKVFDEDISSLYEYTEFNDNHKFFKSYKGEQYKLISYVAKHFPGGCVFIDIGTFVGYSALALSVNKAAKVITYDIYDVTKLFREGFKSICDVANITRCTKNCLEDMQLLLSSSLIVLDIDPHDGVQEKDIITRLHNEKYKGIVICDDIHLNSGMEDFWNWVSLKKLDVTQYGHHSGTGIIVFDPSYCDVNVI